MKETFVTIILELGGNVSVVANNTTFQKISETGLEKKVENDRSTKSSTIPLESQNQKVNFQTKID